ncbi:hypothetical protein TRFO_24506 [Tritrichomonas foetus]|uniref:Collagen-like protein n=1 Tax=Tritrichomonas foetus TaxID=1144522 RepID=A0A1J4K8X6_9EUKA|nr:hypothetical protein TRFO_24506 [Tritrichomonas foetus]|eukprot:OHT07336.1 hypothetical protein TRFO_24506 [Tritrichomonas foetus]
MSVYVLKTNKPEKREKGDFGPQGEKGDQVIRGPPGENGDHGSDATINASALATKDELTQYASNNGFLWKMVDTIKNF